jgi:hypothetical protein
MTLAKMKAYTGVQYHACENSNTGLENGYWKFHNMPEHLHETLSAQFHVGEEQMQRK